MFVRLIHPRFRAQCINTWHSSQADVRAENRLNLSEYQSDEVDQSLESGRTRIDPKLRAVKYEPFLEAWREDAPALALYQPQYLYIVRGNVDGLNTVPKCKHIWISTNTYTIGNCIILMERHNRL